MKKSLLALVILFATLTVSGAIKTAAIFGDNMMLQQSKDVTLWGTADNGASVTIIPSWSGRAYIAKTDNQGRWSTKIATPAASEKTYTIKISDSKSNVVLKNVLVGEVWLCSGQSNMEMPMKGFSNQPVAGGNGAIMRSTNKNIRIITVKRAWGLTPQTEFVGEWKEATPQTIREFSAAGYYFGRLLNQTLNTPVGLILSSWGGSNVETWMSREMLANFPDVKIPTTESEAKVPNRTPMVLYNAMINPIVGYTIKGAIWYQGESNYQQPQKYSALFEQMVKEWRAAWGQGEFPFFYCQIAPYDYAYYAAPEAKTPKFNSAFLREAQLVSTERIPNSGMAVLMDVGEERCIHPANKQVAGERLAGLALAKCYGLEGFAAESPTFDKMEIEAGKAMLTFKNAKLGFTSMGKELKNFEIAGADKKFYPAKAEIAKGGVEVSSDKVAQPVAVRYAFKDFAVGDLFSTEGLPVSSFRTDKWDE